MRYIQFKKERIYTMKTEIGNSAKGMLEIIMMAAGDNPIEKYKRIKDYLEMGKIKLDDAIPMLERNGIDIDKFLKYLYDNTKNSGLIFAMKLRIERKIDKVKENIDRINENVQELRVQIKELDQSILGKKIELTKMRDDLGPNDFIQDEKERPLYIGEAWESDSIKGGYRPKHYDFFNLPLWWKTEEPELNIKDKQFYTELIKRLVAKYENNFEELDDEISEQVDYFKSFLGEKNFEKILSEVCPELIEYRKRRKDERKESLQLEINSASKEMKGMQAQVEKLRLQLKEAKELKEGFEDVCKNYDKKLPPEYHGTKEERENKDILRYKEARKIDRVENS